MRFKPDKKIPLSDGKEDSCLAFRRGAGLDLIPETGDFERVDHRRRGLSADGHPVTDTVDIDGVGVFDFARIKRAQYFNGRGIAGVRAPGCSSVRRWRPGR